MVKKILLFAFTLLFLSCYKQTVESLTMQRKPYLGNELRTDGYYYSNIFTHSSKDGGYRCIYICIFYKNGICYNIPNTIESNEAYPVIIENLETDLLLNRNIISRLRSEGRLIGVFNINSHNLEMETLEGSMFPTFKHYGEILNDSTFVLHRTVNSKKGNVVYENLTYKFKKFSPKPDSTCVYIK